jgi:hypothetical protein
VDGDGPHPCPERRALVHPEHGDPRQPEIHDLLKVGVPAKREREGDLGSLADGARELAAGAVVYRVIVNLGE